MKGQASTFPRVCRRRFSKIFFARMERPQNKSNSDYMDLYFVPFLFNIVRKNRKFAMLNSDMFLSITENS